MKQLLTTSEAATHLGWTYSKFIQRARRIDLQPADVVGRNNLWTRKQCATLLKEFGA